MFLMTQDSILVTGDYTRYLDTKIVYLALVTRLSAWLDIRLVLLT